MMAMDRLLTDLKPVKAKAPKDNIFGVDMWRDWCRHQIMFMKSKGMEASLYVEFNENDIEFCAIAPFND